MTCLLLTQFKNPEKIYNNGNSWDNNYSYLNLWSMNTTTQKETTNTIVKTIYDPNPVGFHMPPKNTFSGITTTGVTSFNRAYINALGAWDDGWHSTLKMQHHIYYILSSDRLTHILGR